MTNRLIVHILELSKRGDPNRRETKQNNIAKFFDLPEAVQDGLWHILTINRTEYEYRAAHDGTYVETMYRHEAGFGQSNPAFGVSDRVENPSVRIGFYLLKGSNCVKAADAAAYAMDAKVTAHRPL